MHCVPHLSCLALSADFKEVDVCATPFALKYRNQKYINEKKLHEFFSTVWKICVQVLKAQVIVVLHLLVFYFFQAS